jgi:hypothetical protein
MADEQLKIKIGADVGQAVTGINQVSTSLKKLVPGSNQATFALTNLGRVAQDAPFGLIGIANNIEPLISSFVALKRETGSASGALKALGSSLMGGGGLILLVGLASTAMTLYGMATRGASKDADDLSNVQKNLAKVTEEVAKSTGGELANLQSLIEIASDVKLSNDARTEALKELNRLYPEHIGNVKADANTSNVLSGIYDKLSLAILNQARARAIANEIDSSVARQRKIEQQDLEDNLGLLEKGLAIIKGGTGFGAGLGGAAETALKNRADALKKETDLQNVLIGQLKTVNTELAKSGDLFTDRDKKAKAAKTLKAEKIGRPEATEFIRLADIIDDLNNRFSPADMLGKIRQPYGDLVQVFTDLEQKQIKAHNLNLQIADGVQNQLAPAFTGFFEDLLSGSKTTFADFGRAILGVIKKLIAAAAAAAVLSAIIGVATGGATFGGGMSTFLGGAKSIFGGMTGLNLQANPGAGSGRLLGSANSSNNRPQIVGVVQGQNIALVLQRFNADRGRNG